MARSKNNTALFSNIVLFLIALFLQYNGVYTVSVFGFSPFLPLCILISISMFVSEISAFFLGFSVGFVADAFSSTTFGFNSIVLALVGLFVSLIAHYLFNNNIRSSIVLQLGFTVIYSLVRWLVFYSHVAAGDTLRYLVGVALPSAVFTAVISIGVYYLEKKIFNTSR